MKSHLYRITVEHVAGANGDPVDKAPLVFEATNHDDLFVIVARMQERTDIPKEGAAPLAIGLKTFERDRIEAPQGTAVRSLYEAIGAFIGKLKAKSQIPEARAIQTSKY